MFKPLLQLASIDQLDFSYLQQQGVKALLIDVDNTLCIPDVPMMEQTAIDVVAFIERVRSHGLDLVLLSNNFAGEKAAFFAQYEVKGVFFAWKPLPFGFWRARKLLKGQYSHREVLHIGDQVLTDGIGASLAGLQYILVSPLAQKQDLIYARPSRWLERLLRIRRDQN